MYGGILRPTRTMCSEDSDNGPNIAWFKDPASNTCR